MDNSKARQTSAMDRVLTMPGLISCWDFAEPAGQPRVARGPGAYALREMGGPVERVGEGAISGYAAKLSPGLWFSIPRSECPLLNLHGKDTKLSVVAWIQRHPKSPEVTCEAIAGMWNESRAKRQYCLFLDIRIKDTAHQVSGHVSGIGGPTPGFKYCMDVAIGNTPVPWHQWQFVGMTYDGQEARSYLNGRFDPRPGRNPYPYPHGIFDGGPDGSDFTVGAVDRSNIIGNWFAGLIAGIAVFNRVLTEEDMQTLNHLGNSETARP